MGKSLGNFITLNDFFSGDHTSLTQAYSPMTIRFFILQAHYRSTLDFSNEALQAAEKGLDRLLTAWNKIPRLKPSKQSTLEVEDLEKKCYAALNDDFNSPMVIAHLFEAVRWINAINDGKEQLTANHLELLQGLFNRFAGEILGLIPAETADSAEGLSDKLLEILISLRQQARASKNFAASDLIRDSLKNIGILLRDTKNGVEWEIEED